MPSPITPITPENPGLTLSGPGATVPVAGVSSICGVPSGTTSGCAGPWFIERQRMRIVYARTARNSPSSTSFALDSQGPTVGYKTDYTFLQAKIEASYTVEKSYDLFSTSAFQQPQTFEFLSVSTDGDGNSYGVGTDIGPSCLGPMGSIETKQEWYQRRLWNSADSSMASSYNGYYHHFVKTDFNFLGGDAGITWYRNGGYLFGQQLHAEFPGVSNTLINEDDWSLVPGPTAPYLLPGPYSYTQENSLNIVNFINGTGDKLRIQGLFTDFNLTIGVGTTGLPEYSSNRHKFS